MFKQITNTGWKRGIVIISIITILIGVVVFVISWSDPLMNYYGVSVRKSQLQTMLQADKADGGLYCQQMAAFSFDATFTCFDTKLELDQFVAKRTDVEQKIK